SSLPAQEELGVQETPARGAPHGVVPDHRELPVEHGAPRQAADPRHHSIPPLRVAAGLRRVRLVEILDRTGRGGRPAGDLPAPPGIAGLTLPRASSAATPGYPAPETACSVVTRTASTPKARARGASASASWVAEQLGLVTMAPLHPRRRRWTSRSAACSALT